MAGFAPSFGRRSLLTIDTEEEFDWSKPFSATEHRLDHIPRLRKFQQFCEGIDVTPVYMIDWPIAQSPVAAEIIGDAVSAGRAEVGIQLHPWVNPPHEEVVEERTSFAGNLPVELEREKILRLRNAVQDNFGTTPQIYRAGRYGFGPNTADLLRNAGVPLDTSFRPGFDYSSGYGSDYRAYPLEPFWLDDERKLLELPITTVFWGMLRKQGRWLFPAISRFARLSGVMARIGMLERIPLTPEGVTVDEAIRGLDMALDDGLPLFVLSFHSPSLVPGNTPYVRSEDDLDRLYDWWRAVYAYLDTHDIRPTSVAEIIASVEN